MYLKKFMYLQKLLYQGLCCTALWGALNSYVQAEACSYNEALLAFLQGNTVRGNALMKMAASDGDERAAHFLASLKNTPLLPIEPMSKEQTKIDPQQFVASKPEWQRTQK